MDNKQYKEIIKTAREAVKDEEEPFKTEAFKMILAKLLEADEGSIGAYRSEEAIPVRPCCSRCRYIR